MGANKNAKGDLLKRRRPLQMISAVSVNCSLLKEADKIEQGLRDRG